MLIPGSHLLPGTKHAGSLKHTVLKYGSYGTAVFFTQLLKRKQFEVCTEHDPGHQDVPTGDDGITRVSPYRLATHLTSAFALYTTIVWTGLSVLKAVLTLRASPRLPPSEAPQRPPLLKPKD